jgi:D-arabinan endo alpha-(1,5)-arabinofuranosidase
MRIRGRGIGGALCLAIALVVVAVTPAYASGDPVDLTDTRPVKKLVGPGSPNLTELRWNVWGADLGSMFESGGRIYMTFGDTYGRPTRTDIEDAMKLPPPDPNTQENAGATTHLDHRSNVMAYFDAARFNPAKGPRFDGMISDRPGHAKELLSSKKIKGDEQSVIPTYGIAVGDRLILHYMSVRQFGPAPYYTLNYSGLAYSDDGGQTWTKDPDARWAGCCDPAGPGLSNFGMVSMERVGNYIYIFGVPGGRWGPVKLARVQANQILSPKHYRYWDGESFAARDESGGATVVPPAVGEFSVGWNSHYRKWLMMYIDGADGNIMMRTASCLTGPWKDPELVVAPEEGSPYAPFLAPRGNDTRDIHFALSIFSTYSVWWWHTALIDQTPGSGPEKCVTSG